MASLFVIPFANNGTRRRPPNTDPAFNVNFEQGFTPQYEISLSSNNPDARAVERDVFNWMFFAFSESIAEWQLQAFPEWQDHPTGYNKNTFVQSGGRLYRSLKNANKSQLNIAADWEFQEDLATVKSYIPAIYGGSNGPSTGLVIAAKDFNSMERGVWFIASSAIFDQCTNKPPLSVSAACYVDAFVETVAGKKQGVQRVQSAATGEIWTRVMVNGNWSIAWTLLPNSADVQSGTFTYGVLRNGPTANTYKVDFVPQITALKNGMRLTVMVAPGTAANTGACSLVINGLPAIPMVDGMLTALDAPNSIQGSIRMDLMISDGSAIVMSVAGRIDVDRFGIVPFDMYQNGTHESLVPVGVPMPIPYTALPSNWAIMEGNAFDKAANRALALIYPSGVLPDLRGLAIIGLDRGKGYDTNRAILTYQADQVGSHSHDAITGTSGGHSHSVATNANEGAHTHAGQSNVAGAYTGATAANGDQACAVSGNSGHRHFLANGDVTWQGDDSTPIAQDHRIVQKWGPSGWDLGYMLRGTYSEANRAVSSADGAHTHSVTAPSHAHTYWCPDHSHYVSLGGGAHTHTGYTNATGDHTHTVTIAPNVAAGTTNKIKNMAFVWACRMR